MSDTLRDQMLKLGFAPKPSEPAKPKSAPGPNMRVHGGKQHAPPRPQHQRPANVPNKPRPNTPSPSASQSQEEIDLAKAYALRAKVERQEAAQAQREAEERAREKRERRAKLGVLLQGKALNVADADQPRHFQHQDKIKRVYATEAQVTAINAGDLGVIMHDGRFQIVTRDVAVAVRDLEPRCVMVLLEPGEFEADAIS